MPRGRPLKNPNGYGTVVKLSGRRRKPFEVRVNTHMDNRYYPVYDVLGRYSTREEGLIGVNQVCIDRLIGHASGSLTTRIYTHKTIEELRQAIEMI